MRQAGAQRRRKAGAVLVAVLLAIVISPAAAYGQRRGKVLQDGHTPPKKSRTGVAVAAPLSKDPALNAALNAVDKERIRAQVRFLASDLLEGRGTGQRGGDLAAEYIATQFALYGLKPAGENGSYLQKVPLMGVTTLPQTTFALVQGGGGESGLKSGDDFVVSNQTQSESVDVDAPIVFVGYGIEAPKYQWNDYKDADVKGKVLLMLVNEPPSDDEKFFKGKALTYYGRWTYKYEEAARKGAAGVILVHETSMASYGWDVVKNSWSGERANLRESDAPKLKAASWIQLEVARKLVAGSGKDLDTLMQQSRSRDFKPVELNARLKAHIVSTVRPFESNNVIAMLPGSEASAAEQAVIYSAHYDHFGIRNEQGVTNIYHGAADNATGCGILLEIARAFALAPAVPRRSILFAAVTAEEQGLLGSEYLGKHPPVAAGKITLGLNYDDVQPFGDPEEVEVVGAERTSFFPEAQAIARDFGLAIKPDARPEAGHYYRSDHFSLARVGIPAFSVNEGMKFAGHPLEWGVEKSQEYNQQRYHKPTDEYKPEMDFTGDAKLARFGMALGWRAANAPQMVIWQAGDEFEAPRKRSQGEGVRHPKRSSKGGGRREAAERHVKSCRTEVTFHACLV